MRNHQFSDLRSELTERKREVALWFGLHRVTVRSRASARVSSIGAQLLGLLLRFRVRLNPTDPTDPTDLTDLIG